MEGKIVVVHCECGKPIHVQEYELMSVSHEDGKRTDYGPLKAVCSCGREYELELKVTMTSVFTPAQPKYDEVVAMPKPLKKLYSFSQLRPAAKVLGKKIMADHSYFGGYDAGCDAMLNYFRANGSMVSVFQERFKKLCLECWAEVTEDPSWRNELQDRIANNRW